MNAVIGECIGLGFIARIIAWQVCLELMEGATPGCYHVTASNGDSVTHVARHCDGVVAALVEAWADAGGEVG